MIRTRSVAVLLLTSLVLTTRPTAAQTLPPCSEDEGFHALDFWVGEWSVWSEGTRVGMNSIVKVQDGCAIEEHWTDSEGGTGQSLFYYLPAEHTWKQVWVTPYARVPGGVKEKVGVQAPPRAVRFQGTIVRAGEPPYLDRTTLTPLPEGEVRQHIEVSTDGGSSWRTTFDAVYRPVDGGDGAGPAGVRMLHPDWSPDGAWLAFESDLEGTPDVWVMRVDGTDARLLAGGPGMESYPRFSPDGKSVAFLRRDRGAPFSMHLVELADGRETPLLGAEGNLEPAFAPDGRSVAFRTYRGGDDPDGEIAVVDLDDASPRLLTDNDVEDGFPSWAPDGRSVYFHRSVRGHRQVVAHDLARVSETILTEGPYDSWHAHASADGRSLVFDSERSGNRDVYLMDLATRSLRQLTRDPGRDGYPKISPDGRRVAFHSDRLGPTRIFVLDLAGGPPVPVPTPGGTG